MKNIPFDIGILVIVLIAIIMFFFLAAEARVMSATSSAFEQALTVHTRAALVHLTRSKYIILVDFTRSCLEKRFFIIDTETKKIVYSTYVSHGIGSGRGRFATSFSNREGSYSSSVGTFLITNSYIGRHGVSYKLIGLEPGVNDNTEERHIVLHSAEYADKGGHSFGCFAVPVEAMSIIQSIIPPRTILYAYTPRYTSKFLVTTT